MGTNLSAIFNSGEIDEKSLSALAKAIESNSLEGFDYIEFKQALANLKQMGMDDSTAFKSAFATASTMGLTKSKLLKTAEFYKTIIDKEKGKFQQALQHQVDTKINNKGAQLKKLQEAIVENQEKIKKLELQISQYQQKIDSADDEIQATKDKLDLANKNFETAYSTVLKQIETDISNINQLI